jgi:DnaJ homolog subfamily C member 25
LTNENTRKEYDFLRYNQEAYLRKYGSDVLWAYAPKSDTLFVIVFILTAGSAISWWAQKQKWKNVADKLIKAAVEDWGPQQGGTTESKELRDRAIAILQEKEKGVTNENENGDTDKASADGESTKKKKKAKKLTPSERRKELEDSVRPIIAELVNEIEDFGAGYHKPTWRDLMVVKLAYFPITFTNAIVWNLGYLIRRLRKIPLSDEEREVLTRRAVGEVNWASRSEVEQKDMLSRDLWVADNMIAWEEEQELKLLRNSERKRYARLKKQGKLDKEE